MPIRLMHPITPTPSQFTMLRRIDLIGSAWLGECEACCSKYMGRTLAKLGWVERKQSQWPPHGTLLRLTDAGRRVIAGGA
jgi:hypothetical protein